MDIIKIIKILRQNNSYMNEKFYVKELGVFGSYVKGKQKRKSDIDILVEFVKGHKDFFNYMRLKYYIEGILNKKVDLVIKGALKDRLKDKILNEADYV